MLFKSMSCYNDSYNSNDNDITINNDSDNDIDNKQ